MNNKVLTNTEIKIIKILLSQASEGQSMMILQDIVNSLGVRLLPLLAHYVALISTSTICSDKDQKP